MEYNLQLIVDNSFLLPVIAISTSNKKNHQINTKSLDLRSVLNDYCEKMCAIHFNGYHFGLDCHGKSSKKSNMKKL